MESVMIRDMLVYGALVILVLYVTKQYNIWGIKKGTNKTKVEARKSKSDAKKRELTIRVLKTAEWVGENFGIKPSEIQRTKYKYNIMRSRKVIHIVERPISAIELIGVFKAVKFVTAFLGVLLYATTKNPIFLVFLLGVVIDVLYKWNIEGQIMQEDKEIEEEFPDLYLLIYSRLLKGAHVRLAPTLDEYLRSLDTIHGERSHKAIKYFVQDLRNNIEIYGDDSMAIHKMREVYKSAMLVNFFNLAIQALRGVDNRDKLLAFKIELSQKRLEAMTKRAQKLVEKGQRAVFAIFIILAQFVLLSWIAKAGTGFTKFLQ